MECRSEPDRLLNLPNELLLMICEGLDKAELCALATLSRRLHFLALSVYFSNYGISNLDGGSQSLNLCDDNMDALRGLRISLFVVGVHLTKLSCKFQYKLDDNLLNQVSSLTRLVAKLASVQEVSLDFTNVEYWILMFSGGPASLMKWTQTLKSLLDMILCNSCIVLTVHGGTLSLNPHRGYNHRKVIAKRHPTDKAPFADLSLAIAKEVDPQSRPDLHEIAPSPNSCCSPLLCVNGSNVSSSSITSFTIHSSMLLRPPCLCWTIETLNISPLTELSLGDLNLSPDAWSAILPRLTLPALSKLKIVACSMEFKDFSNFVIRHPSITSLILVDDRRPMHTRYGVFPFSENAMPQLITLTASPNHISHLLTSPQALSRLQSISIATRIPLGEKLDLTELESVLRNVANRLERTVLSLKIHVDSISAEWFGMDSMAKPAPKAILCHVTCIELSSGWRLLATGDAIDLLPKWMALFPHLESISFVGHSLSWMSTNTKQRLIWSMNHVCPQVKTAVFGEEKVDIGLSKSVEVTLPP